jgi:Uma2 family endonuclease
MPDDGLRYEIIDGELFVSPAPSYKHQIVSGNIFAHLRAFIGSREFGRVLSAPFTVILGQDEPLQPDLLFVRADRLNIVDEAAVHGAPDLIVEILSQSHARNDRVVKFSRYQRGGVNEYWIVDPVAEIVQQFVLRSGIYTPLEPINGNTIGSEAIEGLRLSLAEIFDTSL